MSFILPSLSNSSLISAIKKPFLTIFSKTYNSGFWFINLTNVIKLFASNDFVDISRFSIENFLFIRALSETFAFIFSISIFSFLLINSGAIVLTFKSNWKGSKTIFIVLSLIF